VACCFGWRFGNSLCHVITSFQVFFSPAFWPARRVFVDFYRPFGLPRPPAFKKKNSAGGYESDAGGGWAAHVVPREKSCVIFFGLVALVLCGIRCPGGRAVEIRGCHFWCVRLPFLPDLWFWISPSGWYSRIGTQFGEEAPHGRSALALKMMYVWTQLVIMNNMRYCKSRMCGFFSLRPFIGKQRDIKRTLPYLFWLKFNFKLE
jgi:hypothetical protein